MNETSKVLRRCKKRRQKKRSYHFLKYERIFEEMVIKITLRLFPISIYVHKFGDRNWPTVPISKSLWPECLTVTMNIKVSVRWENKVGKCLWIIDGRSTVRDMIYDQLFCIESWTPSSRRYLFVRSCCVTLFTIKIPSCSIRHYGSSRGLAQISLVSLNVSKLFINNPWM